MANPIIKTLVGLDSVRLCVPGGSRLSGTGVSGAAAVRAAAAGSRAALSERPIPAPAAAVVAAEARVGAYATTADVSGARHQIFGQQKTQLHTMWALRGLDPWSDPA
ncbi:hypothetical protein [Streptomyces sp. PT12]|uniref:hypothetical protein n=1 Tax=Streptomyces sp. PT12 TaxID=1510197 RepID=UPI000DE57778|nr:hypothetical protein [Streptomyces sp. PT12]RBM11894.1 hypothetical protein DEH69_21710 [Streptomyces sp. PT12]